MEKRVPVYHYTRNKKKLHLVSMERIDLFVRYPPTVIEMKAVASKLTVKDEFQVKKYSRNRKVKLQCTRASVHCNELMDQ